MKTLYELLGALPDDNADDIRAAFRKAVKAAHPDMNPGDPEAALKFRQIVRANEILIDQEQRAVYDHLLDLARLEEETASRQAVAATVHRIASGTMALACVMVVALGGYLLFMQISVASIAPWTEAARKSLQTVALASARPSDDGGRNSSSVEQSPDKKQVSGPSGAASSPHAGASLPDSGGTPASDAGALAAVIVAPSDPGWNVDRKDGSNGAIADLYLNPKFPVAHLESNIILNGLPHKGIVLNSNAQNSNAQNSNAQNSNAQNSIAQNSFARAKRVEKPGNPDHAPRMVRSPPRAEAPVMPPPPMRQVAAHDSSRDETSAGLMLR